MKNKGLIIAAGVLLLLAVPVVVIASSRRRKKDEEKPKKRSTVVADDPIKQTKEEFEKDRENAPVPPLATLPTLPGSVSLPGLGTFPLPDLSFLTRWNDYTVNTQSSPLNVRQRPDSTSKIIDKLPKGSTIKAKASGTKGWFAVSKDGVNTLGYASQDYLKYKVK